MLRNGLREKYIPINSQGCKCTIKVILILVLVNDGFEAGLAFPFTRNLYSVSSEKVEIINLSTRCW
jgi:hypothetical protein